jgi:hypothetical protein
LKAGRRREKKQRFDSVSDSYRSADHLKRGEAAIEAIFDMMKAKTRANNKVNKVHFKEH